MLDALHDALFIAQDARIVRIEAHAAGKRFFLASNIAALQNKLKNYLRNLEPVIEMGPDALIMSDPGLITMVRERFPGVPIHLSVQSRELGYELYCPAADLVAVYDSMRSAGEELGLNAQKDHGP